MPISPLVNPTSNLLILVPTYNEVQNVGAMIEELLNLPNNPTVMIVDDFSPDGTAGLVKEKFGNNARVLLFERSGRPGRGAASVFGYREFLKTSAEWLCEIDADFQEDPADIMRLYEKAIKENADLVVGSRYVPGGSSESPKSFVSKTANLAMRVLFHSRIRDATCSFHLVHRRVIETIPLGRLSAKTFFVFAQLHLLTERIGFRCAEVGCHFPARKHGESKVSLNHILNFAKEALFFRLSLLITKA